MTKISSPFVRDRELMVVEAEVVGPSRTWSSRLVLDTGAAATTLTPQVVEKIGYSERDGYKKAKVHTASGEERGYWLRVAQLTVLVNELLDRADLEVEVAEKVHSDLELIK